ncbi:glycosyltransferase family 4 protein [Clostridium sp. JS66]|uniref:glycosyltransferase family 4 protein n=1 Tax=Clostridium sp. JS66 TaxID=3064705 RepID=UPI00298E0F9D|nr:glycosyltransferase family 4 protein [Clostridium sp. JS66]WPC41022.1 glycosyltransferase family 4 protein [Clostridium sp. JS66]
MNILHITTFLQGGAGRIVRDLACHQKTKNNNVFIVSSETEESGYCNYKEYIEELLNADISVFKFDSTFKRDIYLNLNVVENVRRIIKDNDIEIIHAHAAVPAFVGINARLGTSKYIPVVQTMHGWGINKSPEQEKMDITIMNSLDKVITVSKSDRERIIRKGVIPSLISTIYNGINDECIDIEDDLSKIFRKLKKSGYKIVGCIGTIYNRKNQKILIDAIRILKDNGYSNVIGVFIGDGSEIEKLNKLASEYNIKENIIFCGYRPKAANYIKFFDCLSLPSLSEGFGLVIIESFREKTPVIVSDIDVFKEIVRNKVNGYMFSSNNAYSLYNYLKYVIFEATFEEKDSIIKQAYKDFENKYKKDVMLNEYLKLYIELTSYS